MLADNRKRVIKAIFGVFLALLAGYALFQTRDLLFGARLSVTTVSDGQVVTNSLLTVTGRMRHAKDVRINGNEIKTDPNGYFEESLLLSPGYNILTVSAHDRFGNLVEKTYRVLYNETATSS